MATEYYVAPDGDDSRSGTVPTPTTDDGPLATIDAARERVRDAIADGMDDDVTVYIRGGTYYLEDRLEFTDADSGRDGFSITYRNYPGESPRIVGGRVLDGWEPWAEVDGVYRTDVDPSWRFRTLFADGDRATLARHPSDEYLRVEAPDEDAPKRDFRYAEGDVPEFEDASDLQVYVWPGGVEGDWNWYTDVSDVEAIDRETRTIRSKSLDRFELGPGSRYFVQNALELLDSPGEFYRSPEGTVYYYPRGDIDDVEIVAPVATSIVSVRGASADRPVRNLRFEGLRFEMSDRPRELSSQHHAAIELRNAEDVAVDRCRIRNAALDGVLLEGSVQRVEITNCEICRTGQSGIELVGPTARQYATRADTVSGTHGRSGERFVEPLADARRYVNKDNVVRNNHVHHVGTYVGQGHGIRLLNSGNNTISRNRIDHASRFALALQSKPAPTELTGRHTWAHTPDDPVCVGGAEIRPESVGYYQHTRNNLVEYNDLSHATLNTQDAGIIYTNTGGRGNVIHGNRLHDSQFPFSFGFGIYLDDTSDGITCSNNLLHDINHEGDGDMWYVINAKGLDCHLINNVVADNTASIGAIGSYEHAGTLNHGLVIERNVIANSGPNVYGFGNWSVERIAHADHNVIHNAEGEYGVHGFPEGYALDGNSYDVEEFRDWQRLWDRRYDRHSELADPKFMDPEADDYRLRYDSPAYDHGVENLDHARPGLTAAYPFGDDEEGIDRVFVHVEGASGTPAFVETSPGDVTELSVSARTRTGYVADLADVDVAYESEDETVATVDGAGTVEARSEGVAAVRATLSSDDGSHETAIHVLVER